MGELIFVLGGAKSGKTSWALDRADRYPAPRVYLATAEARDPEMTERIRRHRAERGSGWGTVEEPLDLSGALRAIGPGRASIVLLDCLTLWLSNLMAGSGLSVDLAVDRTRDLVRAAVEAAFTVIIVSNEVGLGIVPDNKLAREFRDAAGLSHRILADAAAEAYFITAGLAQRLK